MLRNPTDVLAKALLLTTPAGMEKFLEEAGKPATDPSSLPPPPEPEDLEKLVALACLLTEEMQRRTVALRDEVRMCGTGRIKRPS